MHEEIIATKYRTLKVLTIFVCVHLPQNNFLSYKCVDMFPALRYSVQTQAAVCPLGLAACGGITFPSRNGRVKASSVSQATDKSPSQDHLDLSRSGRSHKHGITYEHVAWQSKKSQCNTCPSWGLTGLLNPPTEYLFRIRRLSPQINS